MRRALAITVAGLALLGAAKPPSQGSGAHTSPYSAIYCLGGPNNDFRYFAAKEQPDGRLLFGVSHWYPSGAATGTYGVADREGDHWKYTSPPDEWDPKDLYPCTVRIWLRRDGVPDVVPDKVARCVGGYGQPMGRVTLPKRAYYRPVTHELDDAEAFEAADVCGDFTGR